MAYLDAGSGALLIQVIAGGAAGIVAFVRYRWRSFRHKPDLEAEEALRDNAETFASPESH